MSKKISEWLKELPMPYREMALDNFKKQDMDDAARPSITSSCIALASAFYWAASEEGFSYWNDVFNRLVTGDLSADSNGECDIKKQLDEITKQRDELMRQSAYSIETMVGRFLSWQLPESVCADLCATTPKKGRYGTNLLSASEAKEMIEYLLGVKGGEG